MAHLDADDLWTLDKLEVRPPALDASPNVGEVYTRCARMMLR